MNSTEQDLKKPGKKPPQKTAIEDGIGLRIKAARERKLLSHSDLHRITGLSRMVISKYESGINKPGAREIRLLCDALDISPNELIYGTEEPRRRTARLADLIIEMGETAVFPALLVAPLIAATLGRDDIRLVLSIIESLLKAKDSGVALFEVTEAFEAFSQLLREKPEEAKKIIETEFNVKELTEDFYKRIEDNKVLEKISQLAELSDSDPKAFNAILGSMRP